jgi:hypothetical protein
MPKPVERSVISVVACRLRSQAVVELENLALRHQLHVLRRQRPGRLRLFTFDRLLWVLLYRLWPRCLEMMVVLVKPATVVQWHRQGFRLPDTRSRLRWLALQPAEQVLYGAISSMRIVEENTYRGTVQVQDSSILERYVAPDESFFRRHSQRRKAVK